MKNSVWGRAKALEALAVALLFATAAAGVQAESGSRAAESVGKPYHGTRSAQERDRHEREKRRPTVHVRLDSPGAGSVFAAPATIELTASVNVDLRHWEIARVEFYANGELLSHADNPPYSLTWARVAAGNYTLVAKAYATNPGKAKGHDRDHAGRGRDGGEGHRPVWVGSSAPVVVTVTEAKALYFIHVDHLATPRLIADSTGTTVWRWDQAEPFGNNPPNEDPDGDGVTFDLPLRLPGQYYDRESGLHYNYFRDYDPSVGRYTETDPAGLMGGLNPYLYVNARPLQSIDPSGLAPNGCGSGPFGFLVPNNPYGFGFETCCAWHDLCYENCSGPDKLQCDADFCNCMLSRCNNYSGYIQTLCRNTAMQYCFAVTYSETGTQSFNASRRNCRTCKSM